MSDHHTDNLKENAAQTGNGQRRAKVILIVAGLGIWAAALIVYWFFTTPSDAFGYGLFFLYLLLPATIFAFSFIAGKNDFWGRFKWIAAFCCGAMFMLAEYGTYSASYMAFWGKFKEPEWILLAAGAAISLTGLSFGVLLRRLRLRSKYRRIRPLKGTDGNETNIDNRR